MGWRLGADVVVLLHLAFIAFVAAGGLLVLRWRWVAFVHLPVALYGVVIELVGFTCPLTPIEKALRRRAGSSGYDGGFVEHYVVPVVYPGEFTPGVQATLALLIVVANVVVYGFVVRTRRRTPRRGPRGRRTSTDPDPDADVTAAPSDSHLTDE